jgi:hypothetical protein
LGIEMKEAGVALAKGRDGHGEGGLGLACTRELNPVERMRCGSL